MKLIFLFSDSEVDNDILWRTSVGGRWERELRFHAETGSGMETRPITNHSRMTPMLSDAVSKKVLSFVPTRLQTFSSSPRIVMTFLVKILLLDVI